MNIKATPNRMNLAFDFLFTIGFPFHTKPYKNN